MKLKAIIGSGIIAGALLISSPAGAAVTFDPETGKGFVGKGDVQVPFGWNDATLQKNAPGVTFVHSSTTDTEYDVTCEWETGNKKKVRHIQTKTADVASKVSYDVSSKSRTNPNGKVNGFNLLGKGAELVTNTGTVPVVGGSCPETGNADGTDSAVDKKITEVELMSSTIDEKLTANHGGVSHTIWTPVVVVAV